MKKIITYILAVALLSFCVHQAQAVSMLYKMQTPTPTLTQLQIFSLFKYVAHIGNLNLSTPKIIEVRMYNGNEQTVAVREIESNTRQPVAFVTKTTATPYSIYSLPAASNSAALNDDNTETYVEYQPVTVYTTPQESNVTLTFKYDQPITTSQLTFELDKNVAIPDYVEMDVYKNGQRNAVITKQRINSGVILFPQYTADQFEVTFYYAQPLRITEAKFIETQASYSARYVRFLARPGYSYQLFREPEGVVPYQYLPESGNLVEGDVNVMEIKDVQFSPNASYTPPDQDRDGVTDATDNCISFTNPDQKDVNNNRVGDACEDFDADGVLNAVDNCPDIPNAMQQDKDEDGMGDHWDAEESRLVEQWKFLPWLGIAVGFGVVLLLFKLTMQQPGEGDQTVGTSNESKNFQKK